MPWHCQGVLSSDEALEMRREDLELEEARYRRIFPEGGAAETARKLQSAFLLFVLQPV
jgi:hypothetical protein